MKKLTSILIAIIFTLTAATATSLSFAVPQKVTGDSDKTTRQETAEKTAKSPDVDTTWFDYKKPKKSYSITTEAQLRGLASLVNEQQAASWKPTRVETFEGVTFKLTRDIKLTQEWTPIGRDTGAFFAGYFDGDGHTISDIKVNVSNGNAGLFGYLTGSVSNLNVTGKITSKDSNCGGIAGQMTSSAQIMDCKSDINISARDKVGGIAGYNDGGTITGCINTGNIKGSYKVGGIAGENWGGTIDKCGNTGKITSTARGVATYGTGGIAGRSVASTALISSCYNTGEIISDTEATGGITGYANAKKSTITSSYNTGIIIISNSGKKNELTKSWAGGVVGIIGTNGVVLTSCYNSGRILQADYIGGVLGRFIGESQDKAETYIKNNYYLTDNCKYGIGDNKSAGGTDIKDCVSAVSSGALSGISSSLGASFISDSSGLYGNNGYPVLRWQEPVSAEDKQYLEGVSTDIQKKLDSYLVENADSETQGSIIMGILNPDSYVSGKVSAYGESIEDMKKTAKNKAVKELENKEKIKESKGHK